jgi:hypothetical protein
MPAANSEKPVTFGASIEEPIIPQPALRSPPSQESNMSATMDKEANVDASNPFSAFYKHPDARRSLDRSKTHLAVEVHDRDLETGLPLSTASTQQPKVSVDGRVKECTMWPSRQAMMEKKKKHQRARGCKMYRNLTNKQRLWAKIIVALLVVAAAVGLGVGISRAVGGGVWAGEGQSKEIPS